MNVIKLMEEDFTKELLRVVSEYYPSNIESGTLEYANSVEYKRLNNLIEYANKKQHNDIHELKEFLSKISDGFENVSIQDYTLFGSKDRCFNIQIVIDLFELSRSHSICINISLLKPYFTIYVLEILRSADYKKRISSPSRKVDLEANEYRSTISKIENYLTKQMCLEKFPEDLMEIVIPCISFQNSNAGQFTFYKAFFMDDFYTR